MSEGGSDGNVGGTVVLLICLLCCVLPCCCWCFSPRFRRFFGCDDKPQQQSTNIYNNVAPRLPDNTRESAERQKKSKNKSKSKSKSKKPKAQPPSESESESDSESDVEAARKGGQRPSLTKLPSDGPKGSSIKPSDNGRKQSWFI